MAAYPVRFIEAALCHCCVKVVVCNPNHDFFQGCKLLKQER